MIGSIEATGHAYTHPEAKRPAGEEAPAVQPPADKAPEAAMATYMPIRMSYERDAEVLVIRYQNVTSGEVKKQIPEPAMLETYRSRAAFGQAPEPAREGAEAKTDSVSPDKGEPTESQPAGLGISGAGAPATNGPALMGSGGTGFSAPERQVGNTGAAHVKTTA